MRTALVTGGAGFIGSHLVDRLLDDGWAVVCLDNFDGFYARETKEKNLQSALRHPHFRLIEGDVRDPAALSEVGHYDADAIVHLAARPGVQASMNDPTAFQDNVLGMQMVLEFAACHHRPKPWRFIFASSSSVYGINERLPWREDYDLLPISPYAASKIACEALGNSYRHQHLIDFTALRFFTVYGPRQRPDLAISKFARAMMADELVTIYGDGSARRDFTYVSDAVEGIVAALNTTGVDAINIGNGKPVALLALVAALEKELGVKANVIHGGARRGDPLHTMADIGKAFRLLDYAPRVNMSVGIEKFANWLKQDIEAKETVHA